MAYSSKRRNRFLSRIVAAFLPVFSGNEAVEAGEPVSDVRCVAVAAVVNGTLSGARPQIRRFVCLATFLPETIIHRQGVCPGVSLCAARNGK